MRRGCWVAVAPTGGCWGWVAQWQTRASLGAGSPAFQLTVSKTALSHNPGAGA